MTDISVTRAFEAPPERVFDAWLTPEVARRFWFATPTGEVVRCDIEAFVGGGFTIVDRRPDGDVEHIGMFDGIDRPNRLDFQFALPHFDKTRQRVTITIAPAGTGSQLTLTHYGVPDEWMDRTRNGWKMILDALVGALRRDVH